MSKFLQRYLAAFNPKELAHRFADVLVVGGGLAGLRAALAIDPKLSVLVITKDTLRQSNSNYAQGGIAGVMDPEDTFDNHIADTMTAGGSLCNQEIVEIVCREAPARIQELVEWGTHFDEEKGEIALGREGGHSHHRIVHALGDATGKEVMRAVIDHLHEQPNITVIENTFTIDLLTSAGSCRGALVWNERAGKTLVWAKQTILCTGGIGQVYRETTNPTVATGDGHAAAYRAGAELRDMEFVQFHPTVLYIAGSSRHLISEAIRGEGAYLVDNNSHRFMADYDERLELAPRDVVSASIASQMTKTRHSNVYLDLSHLDPERVRKRFPGIAKMCHKFGLDLTTDRIPVRPGAHYMIGGLTVDREGRTTLPGLWAAGEVTSSGLHGANRLASNSLLESLVYGAHAGEGATKAAHEMPDDFAAVPLSNPAAEQQGEPLDLVDIRNALQSLMWRHVGVKRDEPRLAEAEETIERWCRYVLPRQFADPTGWELQNMLTISRVIISAALAREETRGVHLRTDFPAMLPAWERHQTSVWADPA
ncbi:MAG: L-aspartate oxidase [Pirellulales bacterium]|nr:L-aspartate oxidase [Pirellulales bacterium]